MSKITTNTVITITLNVDRGEVGRSERYEWSRDEAQAIYDALREALQREPRATFPRMTVSGCSCGGLCRPGHCINVPA